MNYELLDNCVSRLNRGLRPLLICAQFRNQQRRMVRPDIRNFIAAPNFGQRTPNPRVVLGIPWQLKKRGNHQKSVCRIGPRAIRTRLRALRSRRHQAADMPRLRRNTAYSRRNLSGLRLAQSRSTHLRPMPGATAALRSHPGGVALRLPYRSIGPII